MTTLMQFSGQSLVHDLGWTLLHFLWQGAVIALLLWCALALLAGRSPRLRYLAGCTALVLMVLLPLGTFALIASTPHAMRTADLTIVVTAGMMLRTGSDAAAMWQMRIAELLDRIAPWVMLTWFAGVIFFLGRLNAGFLIARRMRYLATEAAPSGLQAMFDGLCARMEISRPVRLLKSALVQVPTVIGWLRPVVLVPVSCFTGLSETQIEAILSHELAHIRRHDYLVCVFQSVVEALLFYHPAVWWVSKQVRRERECCCDDLAVGVGGDALAYAKALSFLEERRSSLPEVALGANGGVLTMRIKRLLGYTERSAASQLAAMMVLMVVVAAIIGSIGSSARAEGGVARHLFAVTSPMELETPAALQAQIVSSRGSQELVAPVARVSSFPAMIAYGAVPPPPDAPPAAVSGHGPSGPLKVSSGTMQGALISHVNPVYPLIAKKAHVQGAVVLHAIISKTGTVENLQALSGPTMLMGSAMDAVRQWVYKPFLLNGQPVEVETTITVNYTFGEATGPQDQAAASGDGMETPMRIGGNVSPPVLVYSPEPEYSEQARVAKLSGSVVVNLWVDASGNPTHVRVVRGLGMGLDEKALDAVKQYKFKPAMEDGKPVLVELNSEVNFKIF